MALKRDKALQPISRDHHHGLLLCWKIRSGLSKKIAVERIKKYTDWFYINHLLPHFEIEEKYLFTILGDQNEFIKKALSDHRSLTQLFQSEINTSKHLSSMAEELENHIRFEERILFNKIQQEATNEQMENLQTVLMDKPFEENVADPFWEA